MSVVVIGAGHAGGQATASLRQLKYDGSITLIGAESHLPYQRPPLTKEYLRREYDISRVTLRPQAFYQKNEIELRLGCSVQTIDRSAKRIELDHGEENQYETLILATGSTPIRPPIPGIELRGVHLLRTIDDVDAIVHDLSSNASVGIIGGGYVGLEAASSLRKLGFNVSVIEMEDRLLKRVATEQLATFYLNLHQRHGVDIRLSTRVTAIRGDCSDRVSSLELSEGTALNVNVVIVGVGVRPATTIATTAGLDVDNGIRVNEHCQTNDPNIYAIGDCTNHPNPLLDRRLRLESVANAMEQARVVANNIGGKETIYASYPWFWSDQYEYKLQMVGFAEDRDESATRGAHASDSFIDFHIKNGILIGADAINSPREFMAARQLCGRAVNAKQLSDASIDIRTMLQS